MQPDWRWRATVATGPPPLNFRVVTLAIPSSTPARAPDTNLAGGGVIAAGGSQVPGPPPQLRRVRIPCLRTPLTMIASKPGRVAKPHACELWAMATQTVLGSGLTRSSLICDRPDR